MKEVLVYPAGTGEAVRSASAFLSLHGIALVDHPTPEATHLLLDTPCKADPRELLERLPEDITVIGGNLDALHGWKTYDLLKDEGYLARNAAITAECALRAAAVKMPFVLRDAPALVIGWGRIGKCLAALLKRLDCPVTVAARRQTDRAMLEALGYESVDTKEIGGFDRYRLVFNTAPGIFLEHLPLEPPSIGIELASKPGLAGSSVIQARGLPGKLAPESSGKLIADTVLQYIREDVI